LSHSLGHESEGLLNILARGYFEAAIAAPDVPLEVRQKVKQYLVGIESAADPTRFAG